ncbi:MAG: ATP-NAD kinase family protein [Methanobacteriota archaeon]
MMRLGLVVNPIAGLGGPVALKGTDEVADEARRRGARPVAGPRGIEFLEALRGEHELYTAGAPMGEDAAEAAALSAVVPYAPGAPTTAHDTREAARALGAAGVGLLVFVGGDGTARDVLAAVGTDVPVLGVPAGVKMMSAVFAASPRHAARIVDDFPAHGRVEEREVLDADEADVRAGRLELRHHGFLLAPVHEDVQACKDDAPSAEASRRDVVAAVHEIQRPGVTYILGPGTTMLEVKRSFGLDGTLLGFDAVEDGRPVGRDLDEEGLLRIASGADARAILTPVGGHGFLLGRGNTQFSARVLRALGPARMVVVATPEKLVRLAELRIDLSGVSDLGLPSHLRVMIAPGREKMMRLRL